MDEHWHSSECYGYDPLRTLLLASGLAGYDGPVYVTHQHAADCCADDASVCRLGDPDYLSAYPNVIILHRHDAGCSAGCTMPETRYRIDAVPGTDDSVGGVDADFAPEVYVNGMPGAAKDTGDRAPDDGTVSVAYHVHGGCGEDCQLPVVLDGGTVSLADARVITCGKAEHAHGQDCLARAPQKDVISTSSSVSSVLKRLENLAVVSDAQGTAQDTVNCQWFFDDDDVEKEWDGDVIWWHVERTKRRYMEIGIRVNIGTNIATGTAGEDLEAGSIVVTLPYYLPAGRIVNGAQEKAVSWIGPIGDDVSGLSVSIDKENDKVFVTNRTSIEAGTHKSVVIFYKADCWDVSSGKDFSVDYSWTKNGSVAGFDMLKGRVTTQAGIRGVDTQDRYYSPGRNNRDTYCSIAAARQNYVYKWDYTDTSCGIAGQFPRMTQEKYNEDTGGNYGVDPDYIYDVMSVNICPTGQQAYDIKGTFVPGVYPTQLRYSISRAWEGELVDAVIAKCYNNSYNSYYKSVDFVERKGVSYDDLPNIYAGSNEYANKLVSEARQYRWNAYDFTIDASELPKGISDFSDSTNTWDGTYCLSFLIRYPRKDLDNDGIVSINYGQDGNFELYGSLSISHYGLDSDSPVNWFTYGYLYSGGLYERPTYKDSGNIYWDSAYMWDPVSKTWDGGQYRDIGALNRFFEEGKVFSTSAFTEFRCYNERRPEVPFDTGKYYRLEGIIEIPTFNESLFWGNSENRYVMQNGDCRITQFAIMDMYDVHREFDIYTGKESYPDKGFPDWANDEKIYIYGSESSSGDDWELLKEYSLEEVWCRTGTIPYEDAPNGKTILRLKAVYPGSRLTTQFRLFYRTEYCPGGELGKRMEEYGKDSLSSWTVSIYQNSDYQAYVSEEYDKLYPSEDLVGEISEQDNLCRSVYFWPAYEVFDSGRSGTIVEQVLYDGTGTAVATYNSAKIDKGSTTAIMVFFAATFPTYPPTQ